MFISVHIWEIKSILRRHCFINVDSHKMNKKLLSKILVSKLVSGFSEYRNLYHYSQEVLITCPGKIKMVAQGVEIFSLALSGIWP